MGLKAGGPLFAVRDMKASLRFYQDVLGLAVVQDFGANVVLTGGLSLQTLETWGQFLQKAHNDIRFGGNDAEMYYVAEDFDAFLTDLKGHPEVELVHPTVGSTAGASGPCGCMTRTATSSRWQRACPR